MDSAIVDWKVGTRNRLVWIDFERYAWRVFAGAADDWYRNSVRFAGTLSQALRVVRSDVIAIDVLAPFISAWRSDSARQDHPATPGDVVDLITKHQDCLAFVSEVTDALKHSVGRRADLALKLRSPRDLMLEAGISDDVASDFGALDDVSNALVGLVRGLSGKAFACLQLSSRTETHLSADEQEAHAPIIQVAQYYGWATCTSFEAFSEGDLPKFESDIALFPELDAAHLAEKEDRRCGGGLTSQFWLGPGEPPASDISILHGAVPVDPYPEAVAEKIKLLA